MAPERGIHFTVFVKVGSDSPSAVVFVEEEDHAFADVNEDAYLAATSMEDQYMVLRTM